MRRTRKSRIVKNKFKNSKKIKIISCSIACIPLLATSFLLLNNNSNLATISQVEKIKSYSTITESVNLNTIENVNSIDSDESQNIEELNDIEANNDDIDNIETNDNNEVENNESNENHEEKLDDEKNVIEETVSPDKEAEPIDSNTDTEIDTEIDTEFNNEIISNKSNENLMCLNSEIKDIQVNLSNSIINIDNDVYTYGIVPLIISNNEENVNWLINMSLSDFVSDTIKDPTSKTGQNMTVKIPASYAEYDASDIEIIDGDNSIIGMKGMATNEIQEIVNSNNSKGTYQIKLNIKLKLPDIVEVVSIGDDSKYKVGQKIGLRAGKYNYQINIGYIKNCLIEDNK